MTLPNSTDPYRSAIRSGIASDSSTSDCPASQSRSSLPNLRPLVRRSFKSFSISLHQRNGFEGRRGLICRTITVHSESGCLVVKGPDDQIAIDCQSTGGVTAAIVQVQVCT